jgi:hypothetical protein
VRRAHALDLKQPRSVAQIFGAAFRLYRAYPLLFLALAVAVVAPYDLLILALTGAGPLAHHAHRSFGEFVVLEVLSFSLVGPLISALHMHAVVLIGEGERPRLLVVAKRGLVVLPVVAATEIAANIGIGLGFVALFVPGLFLAVRWAVAAQVAAVEDRSWLNALGRSGQLGAGRYVEIFWLMICGAILGFALRFGAGLADFQATTERGSSTGSAIVLGIAVNTIVASLVALVLAILYFDLRARQAEVVRQPPRAYEHLRDLD